MYLDHQATTPVDARVLAEMRPYFSEFFGNPHSADHYLGWESARAVEDAATKVGRLIGADADEIVFTSGATESNNLALLGLAGRAPRGRRHRVLLSAIEHKSVLAVGEALQEKFGFAVELVPVDREGFLDLSILDEMLDDDVLVVSIIAVNNEIGTVQDAPKISELVRSHGSILHCDAAQAPVGMDLSTLARHADILSLSSHKMYGPKGIGVIYISRGLQNRIEPLIYGGGQQNSLRSGTVPVPLCVGMGAAAEMFSAPDIERRRSQLRRLRDMFVEELNNLPWSIAVNGPSGYARHPGNASIQFRGVVAHDILSVLQPRLAASTGSACTTGVPEQSHVLSAIGLDSTDAASSVRFSLGFGTSDEDVVEAVGLIERALERLSRSGLVSTVN